MLVYRVEFFASIIDRSSGFVDDLNTPLRNYTHIGPYAGSHSGISYDTRAFLRRNQLCTRPELSYDRSRHPVPENDVLLDQSLLDAKRCYYNLSFGFDSVRMMCAWFDDNERDYLTQCGFRCFVYDASEVYQGYRQTVFEMNTASLKSIIDLSTLEILI